jgi:hypothetical protein
LEDEVVTPCQADTSAALLPQKLRERMGVLLDALDARPGSSLPQACQSWAALKGGYRFFAHPDTSVANLLPALVLPPARLAARCHDVLIPHDSTSFNFTSLTKATGLGFLNDSTTAKGIHLHSSLLLAPDCRLLGIGHLHFWVREHFRSETDDEIRSLPIEQKESFKWLLGVRAARAAVLAGGALLPRRPRLIHVMDREGDVHEVFAEIKKLGDQAVIRCAQNRSVTPEQPEQAKQPEQSEQAKQPEQPDKADYAKQQVARQKVLGTMELQVPLKGGGYRKALVEVRSARVRLSPNEKKHRGRKPLSLGLIEVREISKPPVGEKAAQWWLWTTLPARTLKQVCRVLKIYRARWRLEEYHRAMKTGCKVEKLRLQSAEKLMKAITLAAQVAVRAVRLRDQVKQAPTSSCRECLKDEEWQTLFAREHGREWREEDGVPTAEEAMRWLGRLGGHLGRKRDGLPGPEVLARGLHDLTLLVEGRRLGAAEAGPQPDGAEPPAPSGRPGST